MVAKRYGHSIGGIHKAGIFIKFQGMLQHLPHLLFGGIAAPGNRLFYFPRGVFYGLQAMHHGSSYGHALCTPQFKHTLHILAKEGRLDGHRNGCMHLDQALHLPEDELQPFCMVLSFSQLQNPHFHKRYITFVNGDKPITHHQSAGVYAKNDAG